MRISIFAALVLIILLIFSGCKEKDEEIPTGPSMQVYVDGDLQVGLDFSIETQDWQQFGETRRAFNLNSYVSEWYFHISITNWSWQEIPETGPKVKEYYRSSSQEIKCKSDENSNQMCEDMSIQFNKEDGPYYIIYSVNATDFLAITRNSNGSIDGHFDVNCQDRDGNTLHLEGNFKNIEY
jgi:hypothetical protein